MAHYLSRRAHLRGPQSRELVGGRADGVGTDVAYFDVFHRVAKGLGRAIRTPPTIGVMCALFGDGLAAVQNTGGGLLAIWERIGT